MNISDAVFTAAAYQLLMTDSALTAQINLLRENQQWTGPDADQFFQEWDVDVRHRLQSAAQKLEALGFSPVL